MSARPDASTPVDAPDPGPPPQPDAPTPSAPPPQPSVVWKLENRTLRRLRIRARGTDLVVPPFTSREVRPGCIPRDEIEKWVNRGLVRYGPVAVETPIAWSGDFLSSFVGVVIMGAMAGVVWQPTGSAAVWYWSGVLFVSLVLAIHSVGGWRETKRTALRLALSAMGALERWSGIVSIGLIGFGLPAVLVGGELWELNFLGVREVGGQEIGVSTGLHLLLFIVFVGVVSTLPALLFYLFDRQHMKEVRSRFFREVMRLDPAIQTLDDAVEAYGAAIDKEYGGRTAGGLFRVSGLPLAIGTVLITLGWTATLLPTAADILGRAALPGTAVLHAYFLPHQTLFTFGFLGVYFFTLNMLFRRYVRGDLGPKAYSHVAMRVVIAIVLVWVLGALPWGRELAGAAMAAGAPEGSAEQVGAVAVFLLVTAFLIGIVPESGPAIFHEWVKSRSSLVGRAIPMLQESMPLTELEGITLYDRARLLEEGIENVENLAHHNLVDLMLGTRIPTGRLVDLVDQAILYLHTRDVRLPPKEKLAAAGEGGADGEGEAGGTRQEALDVLRHYGIRTATDLEDVLSAATDVEREELLGCLGGDGHVKTLKVITHALEGDDWMCHLRHWRRFRETYQRVYGIEDFEAEAREAADHVADGAPRAVEPALAAPAQDAGLGALPTEVGSGPDGEELTTAPA